MPVHGIGEEFLNLIAVPNAEDIEIDGSGGLRE